jgi:hypothetical protein
MDMRDIMGVDMGRMDGMIITLYFMARVGDIIPKEKMYMVVQPLFILGILDRI